MQGLLEAHNREISWKADPEVITMNKKERPERERPISQAHGIIDNDLARDNLENDLPFADLQDL